MTKRDTALKAVRHEKTDRLPVGFIFPDQNTERIFAKAFGMDIADFKEWTKCDIKTLNTMDDLQAYISNPEMRQYGIDNEFVFYGDNPNALYDRFGIGWSTSAIGQDVVYNPLKIEDVPNVKMPDPYDRRLFHFVDRDLDKLKEDGSPVYISQYYSLFEKAHCMLGFEEFFIQCYENRELILSLIHI